MKNPKNTCAGRPEEQLSSDSVNTGFVEIDSTEAGPTEWTFDRIGFDPWAIQFPGVPTPTELHYDRELLAYGDKRNVVDAYRYWSREAIIADLDAKRHIFEVAIENFSHDHNIGTVVRTANAFLANKVHIVGKKRWNRRGAMVTDRYQHIEHHADCLELLAYARRQNLILVAVDNTPGSLRIEKNTIPKNSLLLFGSEGAGLSKLALEISQMQISIAQFGSTRSINAGVAAGIIMHEWIRQHADCENAW